MAEGGHSFGEILLGGRGGVSNGVLRVTPAGFHWKRKQGSKVVDVKKDEIESLFWMKIVRGCQLSVRRKEGASVNFLGFREKDYEVLSSYAKQTFGVEVKEQALSTTGRNWGSVAINGSSLMFLVDGKVALEVPLPDVCAAQQQRDEVMLEFHVDDSASEVPEDVLAEMAFHIPQTNEDYPATGDDVSAKVLLDSLLPHVDTEAASTDEAVCIFGEVGVLAPRGRFDIEMHLSYLAMGGQSQDFKVRYTSIQRIFILPKANNQTLVVISLDPPIRKGQTYYTHLLCQFPTDEEVTIDLDITDEALAAKNEKVGGKLSKEMSGAMFDVFARILRGLSGARITRAGIFKNAMQDGVAVRCSYKADDGFLYPLDKAFFYIHKPPLLIPYEDVAAVEFKRQEGFAGNVKTFDLSVRMHSDQEHLFRSVQRTEWQNLLDFFSAKKIRIENLAGAQKGPGAAGPSVLDDMDDMGMRHAGAEDDEDEDEDFDAGAESSDDSEGSEDDEDEEGSGDAEIIPEEGIAADMLDKKKGKKRREASDDEGGGGGDEDKPAAKKPKGTPAPGAPKAAKPVKEKKEKKEASEGAKDGDEGKDSAGKDKEKKGRRKKDPNAPKNAMSAFMYFSNKNRDAIKQEMPDIKFTEIGKVLGERWKAMNAEDKAPYEEMAKADKERYTRQMAEFKADGKFTAVGGPSGASGGGDGADGGGSDAEE